MATHFYQKRLINPFWLVLTVAGLGYMWRTMPLKVSKMKMILVCWASVLLFGMAVSGLAFYIDGIARLVPFLGVFWLAVMAAGYAWNGLLDRPSTWYWFAAAINIAAAILCYYNSTFLEYQYVVAAIVSTWSMLYLWLLRT